MNSAPHADRRPQTRLRYRWRPGRLLVAAVFCALAILALRSVSAGKSLSNGGAGLLFGRFYIQLGLMWRPPAKPYFVYWHGPLNRLGWWPERVRLNGATFYLVPVWLPIALLFGGYALMQFERVPDGHCAKCGYPLLGLPTARCPECGAVFESHGASSTEIT